MSKVVRVSVLLEVAPGESRDTLRAAVARKLALDPTEITELRVLRRALDARHGRARYQYECEVGIGAALLPETPFELALQDVSSRPPVLIIGSGPAGMFAALRLIELGYKPIVLERGQDVRLRRRDIAEISRGGEVNPHSNYCFGEGGAGTYSDGKLYTRATKRGSVSRILNILVLHGADPSILVEAHPHIGTNRLPQVVAAMRNTILQSGGEVLFNSCVKEILRNGTGAVTGVELESGDRLQGQAIIAAAGHSARDTFLMLARAGALVEAKPFALGVRVEHPQALINEAQYRNSQCRELLPPASYTLKTQVQERGVFSFCMCPGGIICPSATAPGEIVTNGWSPSKRSSRYANSGVVVQITKEDLEPFKAEGEFAGVAYQSQVERAAYRAGGGAQKAPAQRVDDFLADRSSSSLPESSYLPGLTATDLSAVLPPSVHSRLRAALKEFAEQIRGYGSAEGVVVATESRTSSPVRITRDAETGMSVGCEGLFPAGEGAGYAGGIVSAAMDGEFSAGAVAQYLKC